MRPGAFIAVTNPRSLTALGAINKWCGGRLLKRVSDVCRTLTFADRLEGDTEAPKPPVRQARRFQPQAGLRHQNIGI